MASALFVPTWLAQWNATQLGVNLVGSNKYALVKDTVTPDFSVHDLWADLSAAECTGTLYVAGGNVIASPTVTDSPTGTWKYDFADPTWGPGATISLIRAGVVYIDPIAGDPLFGYQDFGGDNAVTDGTFTVVQPSTGFVYIDLTPA